MRRSLLLAAGLLLIAAPGLLAQTLPAANVPISDPSDIVNAFAQGSLPWIPYLQTFVNATFFILMTIELLWTTISLAMETRDASQVVFGLVRFILTRGFFYALVLFGPEWFQDIIDSFRQLGQGAAITTVVTPSQLLATGMNLVAKLLATGLVKGALVEPLTGLGFLASAFFIAVAYAVMTFHFIKYQIETYLAVRAAFIFVGFGGSRWTSPYTERYITLVIACGFRLMVCMLFIGLGTTFAGNWWSNMAANAPFSSGGVVIAMELALETCIFAALVWSLPAFVAGILSGAPSLSGHNIIGFATPIAQSAIAGATMIATAASGGGLASVGGITGAISGAVGRMTGGGSSARSGPQPSPPSPAGNSYQPPAPAPGTP